MHRNTMSWRRRLIVTCSLLACMGISMAHGQEFVVNGDFEADTDLWLVWPGYVGGIDANDPDRFNPSEITDWFHSGGVGINPVEPSPLQNPSSIFGYVGTGGHGINPTTDPNNVPAPFNDNGDNDTTIAFMQGTATLQKSVTGLTVGESYLLSLDYNARNCCEDYPMPTISLTGAVVPDFPDPADAPGGVVLPVGEFNPWYFAEIPFTAESTDLSILIATESELGLDSTFLVDNLALVPTAGGDSLLENGDFEADADTFGLYPGYVANEAQFAPFRDNGNNDTSVAFMQGDARLEQDLSGLTVGEEYTLSFDFNARNCCGDVPLAEVELDGQLLDEFPGEDLIDGVTPVGPGNDWYHFETTVIPERATMTLSFHSFAAAGGDATFVLDNVSFELASAGVPGDFNGNGVLDAADIDDLTAQSASQTNPAAYDLNGDALVNTGDVNVWIKDLLNSWVGDADLNGEFNSSDLVAVLASGAYEADVDSVWSSGDFNGDGRTNSSDLVVALADGGYEQGPRAAVQAVPEPSSAVLALIAILACLRRRRR
jgi:hypothetical protein